MGLLAKAILAKETIKFRASLLKEIQFFNYPPSFIALKAAALATLNSLSEQIAEKIRSFADFDIDDIRELRKFIKNNDRLNAIMKLSGKELDDEIVSELLLRCQSPNQDVIKELESFNFYTDATNDLVNKANDLLSKIDNFLNKASEYLDKAMEYLVMALMLYYIIKLIIDLFSNLDFPSTYRLKAIQKLIRYSLASIWEFTTAEFNSLKNAFETIDTLLITVAAASALYLFNKKASQKAAEELMLENACSKTKDLFNASKNQSIQDFENPADTSANFEISLSCPLPETDFSPKEPYSSKLENFTCEIPGEDQIQEYYSTLSPELSTKAIIVNLRDEKLIMKLPKDSFVDTNTVIASLGNLSVYSPIEGYIESFTDASIVIGDISDPAEDKLMSTINSLNSKYKELNQTQEFLRQWEIKCLYPIMLAKSPITDGTLTAQEAENVQYEGMEERFQGIWDFWYGTKTTKGLVENYEKRVKKITGESNVKKNAENETLYKIKEELDKEQKKLFDYLLKIDDDAYKIAIATVAKKGEYELLEYYVNNITLELNALKEVDSITESFRTYMNGFTQERFVIEKWKPEKISDKTIELLKDLEKGATNGSKLWKQGLEQYNKKKELSDVRKWLENIKPRKKLETNEVESYINRIYFLYYLFLNASAFTEKYKDLKESNTQEQTLKEANYLEKVFGDLQKRLSELPGEIKETEDLIENLSLTSNYFIESHDGIEYRNYTIPKLTSDCDSSYAKETASKYELNDIRYWLKWCALATLTGLLPIYWSTGFILGAPILFPVIYIPIKPISTNYGVILIGLTITGIYPFPLILLANESSNYVSPIPLPPIEVIKKGIDELKKSISASLQTFRKETLKTYLDDTAKEIEDLNAQVDTVEENLVSHKTNRPPKTRKNIVEYSEWLGQKTSIQEEKDTLKVQRWKLEQKYEIIDNAYSSGDSVGETGDATLSKLEVAERNINEKLDSLVQQTDKIDNIIAPIPTTLDPYTANFAFTIKNPTPVIGIADNLNENVNQGAVTKITDKFQLNNEGFMSGVVKFNKTGYDTALAAARFLPVGGTVSKDPFPKYEEISPINIPYLKFLTTEYLPKGAQTYGIPGQLPPPVG